MITSADLNCVPKAKQQIRSVIPYLREKAEKEAKAEKPVEKKEAEKDD